MKILENPDFKIEEPCVLALGTFDGLHLAHQKLLLHCKKFADREKLKFVVFSFPNLPKNLFSKTKQSRLIPVKSKIKLLKKMSVDYLIHIPFTEEFSKITADEFISLLVSRLNLKHLCAGFNFRFGFHHQGSPEYLLKSGEISGFSVKIVPPVVRNGKVLSSSLIREIILNGEMEKAASFLGRPFFLKGTIIKGRGFGKKMGFPTANLKIDDPSQIIPKSGVYFCRALLKPNLILNGVMDIGAMPSFFDDNQTRIEAHFFDFDQEIHRRKITITPLKFLRPELKLDSIDLIRQISLDVKKAKTYFKALKNDKNQFSNLF